MMNKSIRQREEYIMNDIYRPKYPIYIISKGRWDKSFTAHALESMRIDYRVVIEPQEFDNYKQSISEEKILILPFSDLGQGSIPARNWIWEHSISEGHEKHWILDDNIYYFAIRYKRFIIRAKNGYPFRALEVISDRFKNLALTGMQYECFAPARQYKSKSYILNTRIYSCILIDNQIPYRWRGKYNEDTDLSLRALKDGYCTYLSCIMLASKCTTGTIKGGNEEIYRDNGRLKMAQSLVKQHPDVVLIDWRFGRWQHKVNYDPFKNNLLKLKSNWRDYQMPPLPKLHSEQGFESKLEKIKNFMCAR